MFRKRILLSLVLLCFLCPRYAMAHGNLDAPPPPSTPKTARYSKKELKNAVVIEDINHRPVLVPPGGKQLYRIRGTKIYVEVSGEEIRELPKELYTKAGSTTYTQVCGVNIIYGGILFGELRNRANVTYYTGYTRAPARVNWMDMRGSRTTSIFAKWKSLGQYSYPSLMQKFDRYGYTQAYGNLEICFYPFGCLTNYYTSRLIVSTSRTYCR